MDSLEIRDSLVERLRRDLCGPMQDDEVLRAPPSRWYLCGFLVPTDAPPEQKQDLASLEEISNELATDRDDDNPSPPPPRSHTFPSSMGLSVLVPAGLDHIDVTLRWSEYEQLDSEHTQRWMALDQARWREPRPSEEEEDEELSPRFLYWQLKRRPEHTVRVLLHQERHPVPNAQGLELRVITRPVRAPGVPEGTRSVAVFWVNQRPASERAPDEQTLFQTRMTLRCEVGFVPRPHQAETSHPDDRRNDLQFRGRSEWVVGHGVSAQALPQESGPCERVQSAWIPQADVFRMAPVDIPGVSLSMDHWSQCTDPGQVLQAAQTLALAYEGWILGLERQLPELTTQTRQRTARELLSEARHAKARIVDGAQALVDHPQAFESFVFANRAMARAARQTRAGEPKWRLFQLAFLLLNLRGVVEPQHPDRRRVDLLFFPTGGGKTEAYLGVAAVTMFLRRLRGGSRPDQGLGVSVLLRYTLRLLTLDQLSRAARLVCAMELERLERPERLGERPFGVGLWVGKKSTPLRMKEAREVLRRYLSSPKRSPDDAPLPIENCPWCEHSFGKESFDIPRGSKRMEVACANPECAFSREGRAGALPLSVVDEQIYRELPEFLIATVDKFASLPWRGQVGMLFGKVKGRTPDGFVGQHENPPKGMVPLPGGLRPPELVIQDELHLISGPLGTMVGLYETALDALSQDSDGNKPKIVASTATARRSREQIQAIFARPQSHLFPPQGLSDGDTFFAQLDTDQAKSRRYIGVSAPGRSMKAVIARVYASLLSASQACFENCTATPNPADPYMTLAAYFNSLRDLGGTQRLISEEIGPRLRIMKRRRPLQLEGSEDLANRVIGFSALELTSRQSTGDIRKAKARLELPFHTKDNRTDVLLASSMISVGVDIDRLGLMVVNGQPKTVAEYIQASSRVGRSHPGLVVTLLSAYRPRDRSHYERFVSFHESFYRYIEASSVTPFSPRALDRGLAGMLMGLARHASPRMSHPLSAQKVRQAKDLEGMLSQVLSERIVEHKDSAGPADQEAIRGRVHEFMQAWVRVADSYATGGTKLSYSPWERRDAKTQGTTPLLHTSVDPVTDALLEPFTAPTSMRDVEPSVDIWVRQMPDRMLAESAPLGEEETL